MDALLLERILAAAALTLAIGAIGVALGRDEPPRGERATLGHAMAALAERYPLVRAAEARFGPAVRRVTARIPVAAVDMGLAAGIAVVIAAAWAFAELADEVTELELLVRFDQGLDAFVGGGRQPALVRIAEWLAQLASPAGIAYFAIGVSLLLVRARRRIEAIGVFVAVAGVGLWTTVAKILFGRVRPSGALVYEPLGDSFPSGHTSGAAAVAVVIGWLLVRRGSPRAQIAAVGLGGAFVAAVGASRVYMGVHWLSDVLGGVAIGLAWAVACVVTTSAWLRHAAARQARLERPEGQGGASAGSDA